MITDFFNEQSSGGAAPMGGITRPRVQPLSIRAANRRDVLKSTAPAVE
jgi:hypothetical protein